MSRGRPRKVLSFTAPAFKTCPCCPTRIDVHDVGCQQCMAKVPGSINRALASWREAGYAWTANAGWQVAYDAAVQAMRRPVPVPDKPWRARLVHA